MELSKIVYLPLNKIHEMKEHLSLEPGDWYFLDGDIGAGKTTLIQSLFPDITSPTFNYIHQTSWECWNIIHMDFYRLESQDTLKNMGLDMYFNPATITFVEWFDKITDEKLFWSLVPKPVRCIKISLIPMDNMREYHIDYFNLNS